MHQYMVAHLLGTDTSIKTGVVTLVFWVKTSRLCEIMLWINAWYTCCGKLLC